MRSLILLELLQYLQVVWVSNWCLIHFLWRIGQFLLQTCRRWLIIYLPWHHFPSLVRRNRSLWFSIVVFWRCFLILLSSHSSWLPCMNFIWILLNILYRHWLRAWSILISILIILWPLSLLDLLVFQLLRQHLHFWIICLFYIFKILWQIGWWLVPVLSLWIGFVEWICLVYLAQICKWPCVTSLILHWCVWI